MGLFNYDAYMHIHLSQKMVVDLIIHVLQFQKIKTPFLKNVPMTIILVHALGCPAAYSNNVISFKKKNEMR